jgi:hypothetical protein
MFNSAHGACATRKRGEGTGRGGGGGSPPEPVPPPLCAAQGRRAMNFPSHYIDSLSGQILSSYFFFYFQARRAKVICEKVIKNITICLVEIIELII